MFWALFLIYTFSQNFYFSYFSKRFRVNYTRFVLVNFTCYTGCENSVNRVNVVNSVNSVNSTYILSICSVYSQLILSLFSVYFQCILSFSVYSCLFTVYGRLLKESA